MKINIGERLKQLRLQKGLTQEQFAEVFGVSAQAVSRWENNTSYPDITLLPGLAIYFNTSVDAIVGMDEIRKEEVLRKIHGDINDLVMQKVSNTEKLAGLVLKVSKWLGVCFLVTLIIDIISFIIYMFIK